MTGAFGNVAVNAVPRIYGASELGVLALTAPDEAHPRVEYVGGELFVGLDAEGDRPITQGEAEGWSRPFRDVVRESTSTAGVLPRTDDGVVVVDDEVAAASILVEPGRIEAAGLGRTPVLFALSRGRLVIAGADDQQGIGRALDLAEELYEQGVPLVSAHPVTLADGAWAPFPWRERFPSLEMRFERILRLFSVRAYEAQTRALQRPDVHLADPRVHVREDGVTLTFATWPRGTATLLPVVDNVMIADPSGSLSVATMDQFLDAAGDAVVRTGLSPARYFVPGEPPR